MSVVFKSQDESVIVLIGGHEHLIVRARLGKYLELEQYWLAKNVKAYLHAVGITITPDDSGIELLVAFTKVVLLNRLPVGIPIIDVKSHPTTGADIPWHYDGRKPFSYIHLIASTYGWSREEILNLRVEEFFAYAQEILVDAQLADERQHRLSKMSYNYDKTAKTLTLIKLDRPIWMTPNPAPIKMKPVPKQLMPVGNVV
jgi:hypothetical protein